MMPTPKLIPDEVALIEPPLPEAIPAETPKRGSAAEISLDEWIAATQACCGDGDR